MKEKQLIPELRFLEFKENLDCVKLNDIAKFSKGKGISKADIEENGATKCIRYGELYTDYNEIIDKVISRTNISVKNLVLSEANDVIIPSSGETQLDIATASCVLREGIILGGDLNIIKSKINGVFLSYYLNNAKKIEIAKLAQGNAVVHLYNTHLKNLKLNIPKSEEQQRIVSFLTSVDKRIELLESKKEKLEDYKKGVMQKIFSQEIRFKDENGNDYPDWEETVIGSILKIGSGKDYKHLREGNIPVYGTGGYMTSVNEFLYDGESVCIGRKGTIDVPRFLKGKFWTVDTLFYTHSFNEVIPAFVYRVFQRINWKKYNEASGVPSLSKSTIEKIKVQIPTLAEQQKIANFLSALDNQIESVEKQLEESTNFKKGLLQKMFV